MNAFKMTDGNKKIRDKLRELGDQIQRNDFEIPISEPELQLNLEIEELMAQRSLLDSEVQDLLTKAQISESNIAILSIKKQSIDRQLKSMIIRKYLFIIR